MSADNSQSGSGEGGAQAGESVVVENAAMHRYRLNNKKGGKASSRVGHFTRADSVDLALGKDERRRREGEGAVVEGGSRGGSVVQERMRQRYEPLRFDSATFELEKNMRESEGQGEEEGQPAGSHFAKMALAKGNPTPRLSKSKKRGEEGGEHVHFAEGRIDSAEAVMRKNKHPDVLLTPKKKKVDDGETFLVGAGTVEVERVRVQRRREADEQRIEKGMNDAMEVCRSLFFFMLIALTLIGIVAFFKLGIAKSVVDNVFSSLP